MYGETVQVLSGTGPPRNETGKMKASSATPGQPAQGDRGAGLELGPACGIRATLGPPRLLPERFWRA
eukprot:5242174-Alexandrium_andersonii.AAC.1